MSIIHISNRALNQSARQAINDVHGDPIWGVPEAVINAFTAMKHLEPHHRIVCITLKAGKNQNDTYVIAPGTGITNYDYIEKNIGYNTDSEEYIRNQKDPDYLNKMGIGIPSIAKLSKDGIAEFRSVSINAKGQEEGLVATYTLQNGGGFIIPAEHPDSKYVFQMDGAMAGIKTGVWVIVKNAKQYPLKRVISLLSEIFARKLNSGYHIEVKESMTDEFTRVRPPNEFCSKHQETIGVVHDDKFGDFPVYADIHQAGKSEDSTVNVLMKKMKIGVFDSEYMAKGYAGCDILDFKPDREGISIDIYNNKYSQFQSILQSYYQKHGISKKPTEQMKNLKAEKKWLKKFQDVWARYYSKNPQHRVLNVDAIQSTSNITGKPASKKKVTRLTRRCPNGFHWSSKLNQCIPTLDKVDRKPPSDKEAGNPRGPNKPHKGTGRNTKLSDEFTDQSIPDLKPRKQNDPSKFCVYINETDSALVFNTYYDWVANVWDHPNDSTMDLLLNIALMNAIEENQEIPVQEFLKRLAHQL